MKIKQILILGSIIIYSFNCKAKSLVFEHEALSKITTQKQDSSVNFSKYKWEVGYGLPTSFGNNFTLGSQLLLKKSFLNKKGKNKAYRFGLYARGNSSKNEQIEGIYKNLMFNFSPSFGIENRTKISEKLTILNGYQIGINFGQSKQGFENIKDGMSNNKNIAIFGEYFLGFKLNFAKHLSITAESAVTASFNKAEFLPYTKYNNIYSSDFQFNPLNRLYLSYNF